MEYEARLWQLLHNYIYKKVKKKGREELNKKRKKEVKYKYKKLDCLLITIMFQEQSEVCNGIFPSVPVIIVPLILVQDVTPQFDRV